MSKTYYLHTISGNPAYFDGDQIVYASFYGKAAKLATSLDQIRKEQKLSYEYRTNKGWFVNNDYGYKRVRTPD